MESFIDRVWFNANIISSLSTTGPPRTGAFRFEVGRAFVGTGKSSKKTWYQSLNLMNAVSSKNHKQPKKLVPMKKMIMTFAALALLTTGSVMAQRGYNSGYDRYPAPNQRTNQYPAPNQTNPYTDESQDWYRIERLDQIVNLSRGQKRDIKRIEDRYDRAGLTPNGRLYPQEAQRLRFQKQQDIVSVLNPIQRDRFYAFQQQNRRGNQRNYGGYQGGYGRRG